MIASDGKTPPQVTTLAPTAALRAFVRRFIVVDFLSDLRDAHWPDTSATAAFSFRGRVRLDGERWAPASAFTALRGTVRAHEHRDRHGVVLVAFTPIGAAALLRAPLAEFSGATSDLADVLDRRGELDRLHDALSAAADRRARIALVERFLVERLRDARPDRLIAAATGALERTHGALRIADLARDAGLSQSALERRFKRVVGVAPKAFAAIARLRHARALHASGADAATIAHAAGYYDQSHYINDFRRATGSAPETYYRAAG